MNKIIRKNKKSKEENKMNADTLSIKEGRVSVNILDKNGKLLENRYLGNNLVVNNSKLVLSHLLGQQASSTSLSNVAGYDPRYRNPSTGGLNGFSLNTYAFEPTSAQLKPLYMAFGSNYISSTQGPNPSIEHCGLFNAINKDGVESGNSSLAVTTWMYGGTSGANAMTVQYLSNEEGVSDAWVRFIVTVKTYQGQTVGGTQVYREAGLFTDLFYKHSVSGTDAYCPVMIARKTFPDITKTSELELQWVWELRF